MGAGPFQNDSAAVARPSLIRKRNTFSPRQVLTGQGGFRLKEPVGRTGKYHAAAVDAGPRPHIHHVIGGQDRLLVVLDDEYRIAQIPHLGQGGQKALVVPLVEADAGLVQNIENTGQLGSDLRGQPDALGFSPREGGGRPVQAQVSQPDVLEKCQPVPDLLQDFPGDNRLFLRELRRQIIGEFPEPDDGQAAHMGDVQAADRNGQRYRIQLVPAAGFAGSYIHIALNLVPRLLGVGLDVTARQLRNDPFESLSVNDAPVFPFEKKRDLLVAGPLHQDGFEGVWKRLVRGVDIHAVMPRQGLQKIHELNGMAVGP